MPETDRRARLVRTAVLILVVVLPVLVLIVVLAQRTWYPTGDQAQAELRMRSLPSHVPLLGAAGRIEDHLHRQGNHPGPLMFWVTWPLYVVLGRSSWAFEAATALVNLAWLAVAVRLVQRRAGFSVACWFGAVALVMIGGFGLDALSQPWNPWVALLPFAVLVLATWSAMEGDRWAPLLAIASGSYALQGHVGYLPLVGALGAIAVASPVVRWWTARSRDPSSAEAPATAARAWVVPSVVGVALLAVLWSGPLWDLATNQPTNVSKLIANFTNPTDQPIGLSEGVHAVFQAANPFGAWVWGGTAISGSAWPGKALVAAWAVVAVVVARRGAPHGLSRLNALLAGTLLVGMYAVSRIFGALYLYTFRWITVLVALLVFTLGWGLATLVPRPSTSSLRRLAAAGLAAMALLSVAVAVRTSRQPTPYDQSSRIVGGLAPQLRDRLDPDRRYLVTWDDPAYLGGIGFGLLLDLERHGFDVGAKPQFSAAVEPHRVICPGDDHATLVVVTGVERIATWRARPDAREVAATDPRSDPDRWQRAFEQLLAIESRQAIAAGRPALRPADLETRFNGILLSGTEPRRITDLASYLVLDGVPSAVFLQDPAPALVLNPKDRRNDPCFR